MIEPINAKNNGIRIDTDKLLEEITKYREEKKISMAQFNRNLNLSEVTLRRGLARGTISKDIARKLLAVGIRVELI